MLTLPRSTARCGTELHPPCVLGVVETSRLPRDFAPQLCLQALKLADDKYKLSTQLSRARAYFRLGKYSRALSDCSEVLGSRDAALACSANQLKGCVLVTPHLGN